MKRLLLLKFVCILIGGIILSSCSEEARLKRITSRFVESKIVIPHGLYAMEGRQYAEVDLSELKDLKLIIYIDSLSCGPCRISHFHDMLSLYEFAESNGNFSVMTIFSPSEDVLHEIEKELFLLDFPYPIYVDIYGEFARFNSIPQDRRFHEFLIDLNGEVRFIGNPMNSDPLMFSFLNSF